MAAMAQPPPATMPEEPVRPPDIDYNVAEDAKEYVPQLKHLLEVKNVQAFSLHKNDVGRTDLVEHRVDIKPGPPIVCRQYRTSPEHTKIIEAQVHEMLANDMVSHSTSPYSAAVLLCKK